MARVHVGPKNHSDLRGKWEWLADVKDLNIKSSLNLCTYVNVRYSKTFKFIKLDKKEELYFSSFDTL